MEKQNIQGYAREMRKDILDMAYQAGRAGSHVGGSLSLVEIMAVLYLQVMQYDKGNLRDVRRDRLILSKGHGAMALYAAMHQAGILTDADLETFKKDDSVISAHPSKNDLYGIECSSGSLGQGLSFGAGMALALKRKGNHAKVYVILGDGECDEGSVWESAMFATHYGLKHLIAIVDCNGLQYDGWTKNIMSLNPLEKKWESFGWKTIRLDGHDVERLSQALCTESDRPYVILADTVKGKGVAFMENNASWHNGILTKELYEKAMKEVMM